MGYKFGNKSTTQLQTCHKDLQLIAHEALKLSRVDFSINEGHRTVERQNELFKKGRSTINGITKKGKHNYQPSRAFDINICVAGKPKLAYDHKHLCYVAGIIISAAESLYAKGQVTHKIRWGGNWDRDGEILYDHNFWDMPHFEIKKV